MIEIIDSLPEEYRIILRAHYIGCKSANEIATLLNVPAESVARIIASGRSILAQKMGIN